VALGAGISREHGARPRSGVEAARAPPPLLAVSVGRSRGRCGEQAAQLPRGRRAEAWWLRGGRRGDRQGEWRCRRLGRPAATNATAAAPPQPLREPRLLARRARAWRGFGMGVSLERKWVRPPDDRNPRFTGSVSCLGETHPRLRDRLEWRGAVRMGGSVRRARGTVVAGPVPLLRPARAATREGELGAATAQPQPPIRIYNSTLSHKRGIMQSVQVLCERDATPTYGKPKLTPNTPRFDPPRADSLAARLIRATLAIERRGLGTGGEQEENRGLRRRGL